MVETREKVITIEKNNIKKLVECPLCKKKVEIYLESGDFKNASENHTFAFQHIHLHGTPLHALVCFFDHSFCVRAIDVIKSVEISSDSDTFHEMLNKRLKNCI